MKVSIAANSYQKITNQNIATEYNKSVVESKNQSLSQIKDTVDITLPKNLSDHSVKVLNCQNGSKALMSFSEKDKTISCYVQGVHGKITPVKPENLASTLKSIDTVEKFNGFLNNAYAKTSVLSDGDIKVDVSQQLKGGVMSSAQMQKKAQKVNSPERIQTEQNFGIKINRGDALEHTLVHFAPALVDFILPAHSSIYVGKDKVIGITNKGNSKGVVEKHNINTDPVKGSGKYGPDSKYGMHDLETIAQRAEAKLGKVSYYNYSEHNCHNFTNWCRTGVDYNWWAGEATGIIHGPDKMGVSKTSYYKTWDKI